MRSRSTTDRSRRQISPFEPCQMSNQPADVVCLRMRTPVRFIGKSAEVALQQQPHGLVHVIEQLDLQQHLNLTAGHLDVDDEMTIWRFTYSASLWGQGRHDFQPPAIATSSGADGVESGTASMCSSPQACIVWSIGASRAPNSESVYSTFGGTCV